MTAVTDSVSNSAAKVQPGSAAGTFVRREEFSLTPTTVAFEGPNGMVLNVPHAYVLAYLEMLGGREFGVQALKDKLIWEIAHAENLKQIREFSDAISQRLGAIVDDFRNPGVSRQEDNAIALTEAAELVNIFLPQFNQFYSQRKGGFRIDPSGGCNFEMKAHMFDALTEVTKPYDAPNHQTLVRKIDGLQRALECCSLDEILYANLDEFQASRFAPDS